MFLQANPKATHLWADFEELLAVANLYQIDIKVITTKGPEDINPTVKTIKPAPELQEFAILPKGKVPNMILIHTKDSHFDLVISRNSRLAQGFLMESLKKKDDVNENETIKQEFETLKALHSECMAKMNTLKDKIVDQ